MRIKTKRLVIGATITAATIGLVSAAAAAIANPTPQVDFVTISEAGVSSINYLRETSGSAIYGSVVEGLIAPSPNGTNSDQSDSIAKALDTPKLTISGFYYDRSAFDGFGTNPSGWGLTDYENLSWATAENAWFLAERDPNSQVMAQGTRWKFKIRQDAVWANGDRVSAEDFVQTIRYIVDLRNASQLTRDFRDVIPLKGAVDLIKEQESYYASYGRYRDNLEEYPSFRTLFGSYEKPSSTSSALTVARGGGVYAMGDEADPTSTFDAFPGAQTKSHSYLYFEFDPGFADLNFFNKLGRSHFLPSNKRFIDSIGGVDNFGRSANTILANGPYKLESFEPDYEAIFVRNGDFLNPQPNQYWDIKRVISKRWVWRVIPEVSTQVYLFQQGKVAEVTVTPSFLKVFQEAAALKKLVTKGGSSSGSTFLKWNLAKIDDGRGALNPDPVHNVHFRRAFALAIDRKAMMDVAGVGLTTKAGDVFSTGQNSFLDANNNKIESYLWRTDYKLDGRNLGPMVQYDPTKTDVFETSDYVEGIKIDRYHNVSVALEEYEKFLNDLPQYRDQSVNITILYSASTSNDLNQILRLQQDLNDVFGSRIVLELEARPATSYNEVVRENRGYDLALQTLIADAYDDSWTFLRLLAAPPPEGLKNTATFNTTGNWTYAEGLRWIMDHEPQRLQQDANGNSELPFGTASDIQDLLLLLETIRGSRQASLYGGVLSAMGYTVAQKMELYTKLEVLIRDQAPVMPLFGRQAGHFARRIMGVTGLSGFTRSYKYAYNGDNVPTEVTWYTLPRLP